MTFASALNGRRRPLQAGSAFIILRWAKVKAAQSGSPSMPGIGLKTNWDISAGTAGANLEYTQRTFRVGREQFHLGCWRREGYRNMGVIWRARRSLGFRPRWT